MIQVGAGPALQRRNHHQVLRLALSLRWFLGICGHWCVLCSGSSGRRATRRSQRPAGLWGRIATRERPRPVARRMAVGIDDCERPVLGHSLGEHR